jgi:23S rRNA pseudouridine2605 synthase
MAKEFKRSGNKDPKEKRSDSKKGKDPKKGKKPSFERYRDESRPSDFGTGSSSRRSSSPEFGEKRKSFGDKPAFRKKRDDESGDDKPAFSRAKKSTYGDSERKPFGDKPAFRKKRDDDSSEDKQSNNSAKKSKYGNSDRKPLGERSTTRPKRDGDEKPYFRGEKKSFGDKRKSTGDKSTFRKSNSDSERKERPAAKNNHDDDFYESKPAFVRASDRGESSYDESGKRRSKPAVSERRNDDRPERSSSSEEKSGASNYSKPYKKRAYEKKSFDKNAPSKQNKPSDDGTIRLNKYISNAGICSRREADELIESGVVQVNGKIITEMGYKVKPTDVIKYGGQTLKKERLVYLILNKPKDYITTVDDPQQRRTVLELVQDACRERIYPVGRLDRATTGLLMFTNDGEMTKKLTHPRYGVRKVYHVELDKPLKRSDFDQITEGLELEDGPIKVDEISYVGDGKDKANVGVEIHSGKNRIVRRIFESLGYNVRKLDRVVFGPLTKKDMPRGRWRFLTEAEIGMLKMISTAE